MTREINYFRRVLALPHGKLILFGQAALFVAMGILFIKTVPWLAAEDISKINRHSNPTPPPPSWARAFYVNHGTFRYFKETRSDAPIKFWGAIAALLASSSILNLWTKSAARRGEIAQQQNSNTSS